MEFMSSMGHPAYSIFAVQCVHLGSYNALIWKILYGSAMLYSTEQPDTGPFLRRSGAGLGLHVKVFKNLTRDRTPFLRFLRPVAPQ